MLLCQDAHVCVLEEHSCVTSSIAALKYGCSDSLNRQRREHGCALAYHDTRNDQLKLYTVYGSKSKGFVDTCVTLPFRYKNTCCTSLASAQFIDQDDKYIAIAHGVYGSNSFAVTLYEVKYYFTDTYMHERGMYLEPVRTITFSKKDIAFNIHKLELRMIASSRYDEFGFETDHELLLNILAIGDRGVSHIVTTFRPYERSIVHNYTQFYDIDTHNLVVYDGHDEWGSATDWLVLYSQKYGHDEIVPHFLRISKKNTQHTPLVRLPRSVRFKQLYGVKMSRGGYIQRVDVVTGKLADDSKLLGTQFLTGITRDGAWNHKYEPVSGTKFSRLEVYEDQLIEYRTDGFVFRKKHSEQLPIVDTTDYTYYSKGIHSIHHKVLYNTNANALWYTSVDTDKQHHTYKYLITLTHI